MGPHQPERNRLFRALSRNEQGPSPDSNNARRSIVLLGPPGAGKTTIAKRLSELEGLGPVQLYLEKPEANPFLSANVIFNRHIAERSQQWFLTAYAAFLETISSDSTIVMDQDFRAVVLVYSKALNRAGLVSDDAYSQQLAQCDQLIEAIRQKVDYCWYILLSARYSELQKRISMRKEDFPFDQRMFQRVLEMYEDFVIRLKSCGGSNIIEFDTEATTPSQISAAISTLVLKE